MATADEYAAWIVKNADKRGTPEFDTVAAAYKDARAGGGAPAQAAPAGAMDSFVTGLKSSLPAMAGAGLYRGFRDVTDTALGAGASLADKLGASGARAAADTASQQGRAEYDQAYGKSPLAGVSRVGGNVLATLPVGGAIASGMGAIPGVAARIPNLLNSIRTSGFVAGAPEAGNVLAQLGNLGTRAIGGGITGAAAGAAVDPNNAGTGAVIGGALPVVTKAAGVAGQWLGSTQAGQAVVSAFKSSGEKGASAAIRALGMEGREAELLGYLRSSAGEIVPGSKPTVAQALVGTPAENAAGVYERVVSKSPGGNRLLDTYSDQGAARKNALEAVAPTNALGLQQAREDLGETIARVYRPEEARIGKSAREQYDNIDPGRQAAMQLPLGELKKTLDLHLGPGVTGQGADAFAHMRTANKIGTVELPAVEAASSGGPGAEVAPRAVPWKELQDFRSSLGSAWDRVSAKPGMDREAAALAGMRKNLDVAIEDVAKGGGAVGDVMPQSVVDAWREANKSFAAYQQRFHEGPQAGLFKMRDGQPLRQGGEIPGLFWGSRPGLADDVRAFRKLTEDSPAMLGQFKSMITTEGLSTQTKTGQELSAKFPAWVDQHITGLREALSPGELESVQRIAQDIQRALKAGVAGKGPGGTSDTHQLMSHALNEGLLDTTGAKLAFANYGPLASGARSFVAGKMGAARSRNAAGFLADSGEAQNMLLQLSQATGKSPNALQRLLENSDLAQLGYRAAPVLAAGR